MQKKGAWIYTYSKRKLEKLFQQEEAIPGPTDCKSRSKPIVFISLKSIHYCHLPTVFNLSFIYISASTC